MNDEEKLFFSKILNSNINKNPFEYMIIDNIFSKSYYEKLSNELYNLDLKNFRINHYRDGGKYRNALELYNKKYVDNYNKIDQNSYIKKTADIIIDNKDYFYTLLKQKFPNHRSHQDYYLTYYVVKDEKKYFIAPHCDVQETLFTILIYCPINNDNIKLGTEIYHKKDGVCKNCSKIKHFQDDCLFNVEKKLDFTPNKILIFAPSDHSWHGVKNINEIMNTRNSIQLFFMVK